MPNTVIVELSDRELAHRIAARGDETAFRAGDMITAKNSHPVESKQGAQLFGKLKAGQRMLLTVVKSDGSY
jgi:hypothetical protein